MAHAYSTYFVLQEWKYSYLQNESIYTSLKIFWNKWMKRHFAVVHYVLQILSSYLYIHFISTPKFVNTEWFVIPINDVHCAWYYVVQSIISWIGSIVALLCTTADTWSHKMVPCPFFSHPSKKQLHACGIFTKKATVVKGSCLRAVEIENVAVWATGKRQVLPKIRQIH
jgi:hypothetical protein